ncbi:hypothetical protein RU86_GL001567 [Lactococcus piscium]|uniref:Uncharacterized protein n=1 Tax=Pseudolactococcus piscium TaxID=1364 RepID=A0A2A5S520_9LACT|nr:hypothetical protein RU86_GL001567 [Lactococcus piscium]
MKSETTLLKGNWILVLDPIRANNGADLLTSGNVVANQVNFTKDANYTFNPRQHTLTYLKSLNYKVKFDASGNVMTLTDDIQKQPKYYYRLASRQYKALDRRIKSINEAWLNKTQACLVQYETAMTGTWSNSVANAQVNLKHDSPSPDAKLTLSTPKYLGFVASFFGGARDGSMSVDFKQKAISDARFKFSKTDLERLLGSSWDNPQQLKDTQKSIEQLTFKDLFMTLGDVTMTYKIPDSTLSQAISVSAYRAVIAPNMTQFKSCTVTTSDSHEHTSFKAYLDSDGKH